MSVSPAPDIDPVIEAAKIAVRYRRAFGGTAAAPAKQLFAYSQTILLERGIRYFVSRAATGETSITCVACGMTSHNPTDIERKYCGNCHVFHGT